MIKSALQSMAIVGLLCTASMAYAENEKSLHLKIGSFTISDATQTIGATTVTFDDSSSSVFSVEYEKQLKKDQSWGFEVASYTNDIIAGATGDASTLLMMGNIRKYFDVSKSVKPYVGGGIGLNVVTINGSGSGIAFQGMAGLKFPFDSISAIVEYKYVSSEADDDFGATVDTSGSGIFAGIALNF